MIELVFAAVVVVVERSTEAVRVFRQHHECPATKTITPKCPGYVVDHVYPLACHGADDESNMQYQTVAEAKSKDRWEVRACRRKTGDID